MTITMAEELGKQMNKALDNMMKVELTPQRASKIGFVMGVLKGCRCQMKCNADMDDAFDTALETMDELFNEVRYG